MVAEKWWRCANSCTSLSVARTTSYLRSLKWNNSSIFSRYSSSINNGIHENRSGILSMKVRNLSSQPPQPHHESAVHHSVATVVQRLYSMEERMRVKGYSVLRWGLAAVVVMLTTLYFFREEVRENVADEVAGVASRSLGDENVVNKANEITKVVLQDIINDPETSRLASNFVTSVLNGKDVRNSAVDVTLFVLRDPKTSQKVSEIAAATVKDLMNREDTRTLFLSYIKTLILDDNTKQACIEMIRGLLEDPTLKAFMAESLGSLVASAVVTNKAIELGKNVTHEVVSDEGLQKETGDALWKMIKDTMTPSWFGSKNES